MGQLVAKTLGAVLLVLLCLPAAVAATSAEALVALKEAGLGDSVLQAVVREKVIETAAFTVEELIALKKAGMADATLEVLVTERSFLRQARPIVYGRSVKPIHLASVQDLLELKRSGMHDDVIRAIVVAASPRRDAEYDRSWEMLNRLGLEIEVHP